MLKFFAGGKPDHPMADAREARTILNGVPANDPFKALEELGNWLESVRTTEGFRPEDRARLVQRIDDTAQAHLRKLQREYLVTPRLSKFQENRMWTAIHEFHRQAALAFAACIELYATGQKAADALEDSLPLLAARALRALAAQMKWQHIRYGPFDNSLWGSVAKIYALAEDRKFARTPVTVYPGIPGESSPEQEFLRAVMLSASSPDSLLPLEIELVERLIAHFSASFTLSLSQQPDIAYWIDLAMGQPPLRLARPPQHAPTLRFFAAGKATRDLEQLIQAVKSTNAVPSGVGLGGSYEPGMVLDALNHLALYWSPKPPERRTPRHRVKSRLSVTHGLDGVLAALDGSAALDFDKGAVESWIVENVSAGGFGASIPQIKGEWLKIGCLLALQPEGGNNWIIGVIRRLNRESARQGAVGIQTLAKAALAVKLALPGGQAQVAAEAITGVLLDPSDGAAEARLLLRQGTLVAGRNLGMERNGKNFLLLPAGVADTGEDYESARFRQMIRETGE